MKALSWKEPFASLMLHGKIETRTWPTDYRGPVLICVSKKMYTLAEELAISGQEQFSRISQLLGRDHQYHFGHAIAAGMLVGCRPMIPEDEDDCFVQYREELWCHLYSNIVALDPPLPWKGSQRWRDVPREFINKIRYKK